MYVRMGTELDRTEFNEKCQQVDFIAGKVKELENSRNNDNLGYIG